MHDMSDRFLHQLAADHRASLLRSGRAASKRPFRRALRAGLAGLGLVAGRNRGESESPSTADRSYALEGNTQDSRRFDRIDEDLREPDAADVVTAPGSASTSPLHPGAQQA